MATLACQSRQNGNFGTQSHQSGDFGMPKSPDWQLWHAKVTSLATLACQSRQTGDFGMPESPNWRLWRARVPNMATFTCPSCQNRDFGTSKSPVCFDGRMSENRVGAPNGGRELNLLPKALIESFWDALWLGIQSFLCLNG